MYSLKRISNTLTYIMTFLTDKVFGLNEVKMTSSFKKRQHHGIFSTITGKDQKYSFFMIMNLNDSKEFKISSYTNSKREYFVTMILDR